MTAYFITGEVLDVPVDTATTITLTEATNSVTGSKSTSVLKVDNPDLTTICAIGFSLTGSLSSYDATNATAIAPGGTVFVQVAPAGYTGSVYIRITGGSGAYVQPVSIIG